MMADSAATVGALVLVGAIGLASCSTASAPEPSLMRIATARDEYGPGTQVTVHFTNVSAGRVYYSPCIGFLDRQVGLGWRAVGLAAGPLACRDMLDILEAGASDSTVLPLSATLSPGAFRYRFTGMYRDDSAADSARLPEAHRVSNTFIVIVRD